MAVERNLRKHYSGESIEFDYNKPLDEYGTAIVVADWTWRSTVKSSLSDADPGISQVHSPASGITFPTATRVRVRHPASITATLSAPATYYVDLRATNIADTTRSKLIMFGTVEFDLAATDTTP